jgi:predicted DNA-binding transcriptional regulator AlpA
MWRVDGNAPRTYVLPSGQLRFKQIDVDEWLESRVEYNGKGAA